MRAASVVSMVAVSLTAHVPDVSVFGVCVLARLVHENEGGADRPAAMELEHERRKSCCGAHHEHALVGHDCRVGIEWRHHDRNGSRGVLTADQSTAGERPIPAGGGEAGAGRRDAFMTFRDAAAQRNVVMGQVQSSLIRQHVDGGSVIGGEGARACLSALEREPGLSCVRSRSRGNRAGDKSRDAGRCWSARARER